MDSKDIAVFINRLLDEGWTQAEIAKAVGSSQGHISHLASGREWDRGPSYKLICGLLALSRHAPPNREAA